MCVSLKKEIAKEKGTGSRANSSKDRTGKTSKYLKIF